MDWIIEIFGFLWNLLQNYWLELVLCAIIIIFAFFCLRLLRAIFSRLRFARNLKRIAKKYNIELKVCRFSLASLFLGSVKMDIKMKMANEIFNIYFCPGYVRKKRIYVFDDTKIYYSKIRARSFFGNRNWGGSPSLVSVEEKTKKEYALTIPYTDQEHTVLMLEPAPIGLFVYRGNGYSQSGKRK